MRLWCGLWGLVHRSSGGVWGKRFARGANNPPFCDETAKDGHPIFFDDTLWDEPPNFFDDTSWDGPHLFWAMSLYGVRHLVCRW